MGLIKAGLGALGGTLADQWKEFFYCEAMPKEVLVTKGQKRVSARSSNTKASDNVITNGSGIAVADGQCMMIVEQGKVVELCAEPGEFTYDSSTEPSIFAGSLGDSIKDAQKAAMYRDPTMAAATLVGAQADAMKTAAGNAGGAAIGFMGMNMAQNSGGMNAQNLFAMGAQQQAAQQQKAQSPAQSANTWKCSCGAVVSGKFCPECRAKKPEQDGWMCSCGTVNKGKFCQNCGSKKPESAPLYRCDKCGWEPKDPAHPPKFCPECGDPFDDSDRK